MVHVVQSKEDFEQQLSNAGDKLIVIDFCANWCGPCKIIAPKLEELAAQYTERAVVLKVNVDENEEITLEYNITSMPTFVFIKNGEVLDIFVGGNSDKLAKSMEKYVGDADEPDELQQQQQQVDSASASDSAVSGSTMGEIDEEPGNGNVDDMTREISIPNAINDERVLEN
ncbi:thioredoxin-T [Drosophila innubila]|uniref:thioredoxin-T n=1 Tax=Drosophila innubila TaxID=198719 RepID=UPI00148B4593|nr:thioredoxin-T [Drosophila innubila]